MRVAIVNDLTIALETLKAVVRSKPEFEIAWTALNGREAIERCRSDRPDLILMDMIMPDVDGVEATRAIMKECPCPILVVTASVEGNAGRVYEALGYGALDAVATPVVGLRGNLLGAEDLLRKIEHVRLLHCERERPASPPRGFAAPIAPNRSRLPVLALGASTGGPQALAAVLGALTKPFPHPILVVQHLGSEFVAGLAEWLGQQSGHPTRLVRGDEPLKPGAIHIAASEAHLVVLPGGMVGLREQPRDHLHRPSVDVLFASLAESGATGVAALLTGMGRDGAANLLRLKSAGWWTIAQDQATSVVWGMPGEAVRLGAACATLPLAAIGPAIVAAFARLPGLGGVHA